MLLGIVFVKPALPPAALAEPVSTESSEPTEETPLVNPVAQPEDLNVSGWALFKEVDFYLIFLYNGLCSGVGLCCEIRTCQ